MAAVALPLERELAEVVFALALALALPSRAAVEEVPHPTLPLLSGVVEVELSASSLLAVEVDGWLLL